MLIKVAQSLTYTKYNSQHTTISPSQFASTNLILKRTCSIFERVTFPVELFHHNYSITYEHREVEYIYSEIALKSRQIRLTNMLKDWSRLTLLIFGLRHWNPETILN